MSYPILGICGPAGSGKDTVAAMVESYVGRAQRIALADPMKRLAQLLFNFNENQLWGPSETRNAPDQTWTKEALQEKARAIATVAADMRSCSVEMRTGIIGLENWLEGVLPPGADQQKAGLMLQTWLEDTLVECIKRGSMTPRYVLQTLGTEWGRHFSRNLWLDKALRDAAELLEDTEASYHRTLGVVARPPDGPPRPPRLIIITDVRFRNEILAIRKLGGKVWNIVPPTKVDTGAIDKAGVKGHASEAEQNSIPEEWYDIRLINDKAAGKENLQRVVDQAVGETLFTSPLTYYSAPGRQGYTT